MNIRWIAVGLIAVTAIGGERVLVSQTVTAPGHAAVNEDASRAVLAKDTLQLQLQLTAPAAAGTRVAAWLISPVDTADAEIATNLQAGSRVARLTLPWPKEPGGNLTKDIGWYRIGYRIDANGTASSHGIVAVGAIARNLLALRLARPEKPVPGKPLDVRVWAGNPVTRAPFSGVEVQATLTLDATDDGKAPKQTMVLSGRTGSLGEVLIHFPVKPAPGQTATLKVIGAMTGARAIEPLVRGMVAEREQATIESDIDADDRSMIYLETDKPLHKPGEVVHLRALAFDGSHHPVANTPFTLTISDPDDKTLLEVPLTTNRFGIAYYDWKTTLQLDPGDYDASFEDGPTTTIRIQRYDLPEFAVSAAMDRGYYLEGETPVAQIHAGYLFGKPVASGALRIIRAEDQHWNVKTGKWEEPEETEQTATLDANGDADLHLDVKKDFDDLKNNDYERYTDLRYRALVTDSTTGRTEPRNFTVRLTRYPVHIYIQQLGANEREGDFMVSTSYADGSRVACKVTLDWMDASSRSVHASAVTTSKYGLAKVHLRFPPWELKKSQYGYTSGYGLRLTARDPEGRTSRFDDTEEPASADSIWISVAQSLLKPGQPIDATMHGPVGATIDVDVVSEGGQLAHQQVRMHGAQEPLIVSAGPAFHGLVSLQAYRLNEGATGYRFESGEAMKSVLYPEDRELKIRISGVLPTYLPGAKVDAVLGVHNPSGSAAPSALGVAVIDTAVEQRAETEEEQNNPWYGSSWWLDDNNVAGVSLESLNKTDMSQPVPDDLDLAAEAVLPNSTVQRLDVETSENDDPRTVYESEMERDVKPLGAAILNARPDRLPATMDALREIVKATNADDGLLLDPWGTPYKVETSIEWNTESIHLISAGPDKRFGTEDDFNIELAQRNYFALPGDRLNELLEAAMKNNTPLPGTSDALKALARAAGLNLDAILDPGGQPYHYEVEVRSRTLSVHVFPHDATAGKDGHYSEGEVWTSHSIDYFLQTEARLEAAIRAWTDGGKQFPANETEARQAFTAAEIDFDALRDPLGAAFRLRATELMAYSGVERVKAADGQLTAKSRAVTRMMRAIQVLRAATPAGDKPSFDVVAQFLHPISEQSGSDLTPQPVDEGTFKGNNGAIGGTVTDQVGAVIVGAVIDVKTTDGVPVATGKSELNGIYLIPDLAPGLYSVQISANGFLTFRLNEVHVGSTALTTVDAMLRVGATSSTVTVTSGADANVATDSAEVSSAISNITGSSRMAAISEPTFTPRLRHVFEETAFWAPSLETNANGRVSLHFSLPDSLTTWKLHALASTVDGRLASLDKTFQTFQPFFVDLDTPQVLTVGDEITLPVNLRNYTAHALTLPVTAKAADWFSLFTPSTVSASVPSNGTTPVIFGFRAVKAVEDGPLRITAANGHDGDAVEKTISVHPDGEPRSVTASGLLRTGSTTMSVDLPADAIPGSIHAELLLYPNLGAHLLHSMTAVLERPYGCGEQTISSTYPSVLYLKLLKASHSTSPKEEVAQNYLQQGYDRLLGYFGAGGGLTYWGRSEAPDPALTAYGIQFLIDAEPYVTVDRSRIEDALEWLISNQQADGSWKPLYGDTNADLNLYVASVLKHAVAGDDFAKSGAPKGDASALRDRANTAAAKGVAWAATSAAAVHDPYANALRLSIAGDPATAGRLRAELAQTAVRDRNGVHWQAAASSPFYGWGHAGELETTALVMKALEQGEASTEDKALNSNALPYLLHSQDRYGIWYSGQATVRVLEVLLPLAINELKSPSGSQPIQLAIDGVGLGEKDAEALRADPKLLDAPRSLDLTAILSAGHHELAFTNVGEGALASAEVSASYYVPWPATAAPAKSTTQTGSDYGLDFGYSCNAEHAQVGQAIECEVGVRRFGSLHYGMLLAELGLPPGADVDRASLAKLLDDWTVSRYELQPDRVVFYLWSWNAVGTHFAFSFTPRYAIHAKAAPASLSDYYNPDLKSVLAPQQFTVLVPVADRTTR